MNTADDRQNIIADLAIERLIDGDLDDAGRRELLLKLDHHPDGWRRCALAFLEDQAWRKALAGATTSAPLIGPIPDSTADIGRRRAPVRLSIAASLLAATFAAGMAVGGSSRGKVPVAADPIRPLAATPDRTKPSPDPVREVGWIELVDQSSGESPPPRVPIFSGPGLDEKWLRDRPPSIPAYVRAQWERQGYQVDEHRRVVSVVLEDGRRVSIPIDEVALEYVGQQTF